MAHTLGLICKSRTLRNNFAVEILIEIMMQLVGEDDTGCFLSSFFEIGHEIYEPRCEKMVFCICENKDADQLRGNREADQRLCFRITDSTIPLPPKYEISSF